VTHVADPPPLGKAACDIARLKVKVAPAVYAGGTLTFNRAMSHAGHLNPNSTLGYAHTSDSQLAIDWINNLWVGLMMDGRHENAPTEAKL